MCRALGKLRLDHGVQPLLCVGDGPVNAGICVPVVQINKLHAQTPRHLVNVHVGGMDAFWRQHLQTGERYDPALRGLGAALASSAKEGVEAMAQSASSANAEVVAFGWRLNAMRVVAFICDLLESVI